MSTDVKNIPNEAIDSADVLNDPKKVHEAACRLPAEARAELATALLRTLDDEEDEDPAEVEAAWKEELLRRQADIHAGRVQTCSVDDVMADIDAIVNDARKA